MARALAIETSGRVGSVALAEQGGRVIAESQFPHGLKHAAEMLPMIDRLCRERGWTPANIEHAYVSAGPGSFTGLRIGITLAKTLALARGVKVVAVPSVRVLVENAPQEARHVVIVLDAKRGQIFTGRFERTDGEWVEREGAHLDSLTAMLERAPRPLHLMGEGIPFHEKFIPNNNADVMVTAPDAWRARAGAVAMLGARLAQAGRFVDPYRLAPIYIRPPEAEEKLAQAAKK